MGMKIIEDFPLPGIPAREMRDGQIARIVAWSNDECRFRGRPVQRHGPSLVAMGRGECSSWPNAFDASGLSEACRVEILPNGKYTFEVFNNE